MEQEKLNIDDGSGDRNYFTIVPNYILNHSTAYDQALYLQLKRLAGDGKKNYCYPSLPYFRKQLKIGYNNLKKSLKYLIDNKWIDYLGKRKVNTKGGCQWVNCYKINDIWKLNIEYYQGYSNWTTLEEDKGSPELSKGSPELSKGSPVIPPYIRTKKNSIKEQMIFSLKNWNDRQTSPIVNFIPENIVNKYGAEKIDGLIKRYGQEDKGFSQFLQALKAEK